LWPANSGGSSEPQDPGLRAGVLNVRRGEGTFFAQRSTKAIQADRRHILADGAQRFAEVALSVKAGRAEAAKELDRAFEKKQSIESGVEA